MVESSEPHAHFLVPSGIGDISWIYSKLVSLDVPLHMSVTPGQPQRAVPYLELLPRVVRADYGGLPTDEVLRLGQHPNMRAADVLLRAREKPLPIQINTHLEHGQRIELYMPELPVQHHYRIAIPEADVMAARRALVPWERFVTFYCANARTAAAWKGWASSDWAEMAALLVPAYQLDGVVMIGADWDISLAAEIAPRIEAAGVAVKNLTGHLSMGASLHVIREGRYLVAFPSGMPILAAVMRCPVMMFYPKHLEPMQIAFADPEMIEEGTYKGCQFCPATRAFAWIKERWPVMD